MYVWITHMLIIIDSSIIFRISAFLVNILSITYNSILIFILIFHFVIFVQSEYNVTLTIKKSLHVSIFSYQHLNLTLQGLCLAAVLASQGFSQCFTAVMIAMTLLKTIFVIQSYLNFFLF